VKRTSRPLTVVALLLGLFLAALEMTVVSTAMPTVVAELGGLPLYAWAFAAYMLATTVTVPIWGKLADLRGRKPVLLAGIGLFLAGSLACGSVHSMTALIAWRAMQGLGAGAMQPVTFTIIGDLFDVHERGRMQGLFGAVWGLAGLIGPLVGGAIVHSLGWRWIFWVNVPFGLASAAVLAIAYHEKPEHHDHRLDVGGAALLAVAVVALLLGARSRGAGLVALPSPRSRWPRSSRRSCFVPRRRSTSSRRSWRSTASGSGPPTRRSSSRCRRASRGIAAASPRRARCSSGPSAGRSRSGSSAASSRTRSPARARPPASPRSSSDRSAPCSTRPPSRRSRTRCSPRCRSCSGPGRGSPATSSRWCSPYRTSRSRAPARRAEGQRRADPRLAAPLERADAASRSGRETGQHFSLAPAKRS